MTIHPKVEAFLNDVTVRDLAEMDVEERDAVLDLLRYTAEAAAARRSQDVQGPEIATKEDDPERDLQRGDLVEIQQAKAHGIYTSIEHPLADKVGRLARVESPVDSEGDVEISIDGLYSYIAREHLVLTQW